MKWHENAVFDARDRYDLERDAAAVPGTEPATALVAVSRTGTATDLDLATAWGPDEIVEAFRKT
ncbi:MAG: hypothetical protein ACFCVF_16385 [Kineosporiaceae bacterium]